MISYRDQAKRMMQQLKIDPAARGATEDEIVDELVEYVIKPVLDEQQRIGKKLPEVPEDEDEDDQDGT